MISLGRVIVKMENILVKWRRKSQKKQSIPVGGGGVLGCLDEAAVDVVEESSPFGLQYDFILSSAYLPSLSLFCCSISSYPLFFKFHHALCSGWRWRWR